MSPSDDTLVLLLLKFSGPAPVKPSDIAVTIALEVPLGLPSNTTAPPKLLMFKVAFCAAKLVELPPTLLRMRRPPETLMLPLKVSMPCSTRLPLPAFVRLLGETLLTIGTAISSPAPKVEMTSSPPEMPASILPVPWNIGWFAAAATFCVTRMPLDG